MKWTWGVFVAILLGVLIYTYNRTPVYSKNVNIVTCFHDKLEKHEKEFNELALFLDTFNIQYDDVRLYRPVGFDRIDYEYRKYSKELKADYYAYVKEYSFPSSLRVVMQTLEIRYIYYNKRNNYYRIHFNNDISNKFIIYLVYAKSFPPNIPNIEELITNYQEESNEDWVYILEKRWGIWAKKK